MSDPYFHFLSGMVVGGTLGNMAFRTVPKQPNPMFVAVSCGIISMALDFDHLPRLIEAGWSLNRMLSDTSLETNGRLLHISVPLIACCLTLIMSLIALGYRKSKLKDKFIFTTCLMFTISLALITHVVMDYMVQCMVTQRILCRTQITGFDIWVP